MGWSKSQAAQYARELRHSVKDGWRFLTPELRDAVIAAKVLSIVQAQDVPCVRVEAVNELHAMVRQAMGLEEA